MKWLNLVIGALGFLSSFFDWMKSRNLKEQGRADQIKDSLIKEKDRVEDANTARHDVPDDADSVRNDPDNRD